MDKCKRLNFKAEGSKQMGNSKGCSYWNNNERKQLPESRLEKILLQAVENLARS
jgi:hypothetical protein